MNQPPSTLSGGHWWELGGPISWVSAAAVEACSANAGNPWRLKGAMQCNESHRIHESGNVCTDPIHSSIIIIQHMCIYMGSVHTYIAYMAHGYIQTYTYMYIPTSTCARIEDNTTSHYMTFPDNVYRTNIHYVFLPWIDLHRILLYDIPVHLCADMHAAHRLYISRDREIDG